MSFTDTPDFVTGADKHDTAFPEFSMEPIKNNFRSEREGKPVFEDAEFVTIRVPGDRKTEWHGRVTEEHRRRWPTQYAAFKAQQDAPTEGTPLKEWAALTRSQVLELAAANVKTVEQLAALPDDLLHRAVSMGGFALREKATRFLEQAAGVAVAERLAAEKEEAQANMQVMQQTIDALRSEVEALKKAGAQE
jgi:phage gp37-like protein